jgi:hypothetical protein
MADYETLSLKLTNNITLADIDKRAGEIGMSRSQFVNMALEMILSFDNELWQRISNYSEGLHIPEWLVIQNMLIKRFAEEAAHIEVWGPSTKMLDEFVNFDGKTATGEELFNMLKQRAKKEEEREKIEVLLKEEIWGLDEEDKQFLFKHRAGRAWYESEEYKKEQEEEQNGRAYLEQLITEGIIGPDARRKISPRLVSTLLKGMEKGEFTKETVIKQIKLMENNKWEWENED